MDATPRPPAPADVEKIVAIDDPVARNLQITQCYHELSAALATWIPGALNWCTVATWASRQAGQSIRREDLRRTLERLIAESREIAEAAERVQAEGAAAGEDTTESLAGAAAIVRDAINPAAAFERTAEAVARGNRKVFEEIGLAFARFLALFHDGPPDRAAIDRFNEDLRRGDPPDGQRLLRSAFAHYHTALSEPDGKTRAELMLLANLEIGLHEQTRLQPEIREAMDAPVYKPDVLRERILTELFPDSGSKLRLLALRLAGRADPLFEARDRLADEVQRLGRLAITEVMLTLDLPHGRTLRLGQTIRGAYPQPLQTIGHPELLDLLAQFSSAAGIQARADWSRLPDRMRFIAQLFRIYQEDITLFDPPYTPKEWAELRDPSTRTL